MNTEMSIKTTAEGWSIVDGDTHLSKWVEESGKLDHDRFLPALVCNELNEGDFVIDCGANIGSHTIAYSNAVFSPKKHGMIVAIEAGSLAFECLRNNIAKFPHQNVYALHSAVSEGCGDSVAHNPNENLGASVCEMVSKEHMVDGNKYLLTVTIDFIAHQAQQKVSFIKLDVEGFEVKALLGASKVLKEDRPGLLIEVNQEALKIQGDTEQDILDLLKYHDYTYEIAQPDCKLGDPMFDIICFPAVKEAEIVVRP